MAGTIIADYIRTDANQLSLNVGNTTFATINSSGFFSNTGTQIIAANGVVTLRDGQITAPKMGYSGAVLQVATANFSYSNTVSTTSQMNYSSSAPTVAQGAQIGSITFTPVSSSSTIILSFGGTYSTNTISNIITAMFEGSTCIGAMAPRYPTVGESGWSTMLQLSKPSNGTQTYTVRFGMQNAGLASFLAYPAYTVTQSMFTIMEIKN